ncbi:MAG: hypothetical protein ACJAVN_000879 [Roseivirga sp.]|jgi:hypothetical protein
MENSYQVQVLELKEVHELPKAWNSDALKNLLRLIEYDEVDEIAEDELKDMAIMALSDLDPDEAAVALLELRLGDRLNKGQRQNLSEELKGERLWEEYAQIQDHEELINVTCMLYWTFPKKYSQPDIVRIKLKIVANNSPSKKNLQHLTAPFVARLLNDGMDDHNLIYRLFDEQLASHKFMEAEHIVWTMDNQDYDTEGSSIELTIHTSWNWIDELRGVETYESKAYADQ